MNKKLYNVIDKVILVAQMNVRTEDYITISFYKYCKILNPIWFRDFLFLELDSLKVVGRIYLATEGINAQIALPKANRELFISKLNEIDFLKGIRLNYAIDDNGKSFYKLKIKIRHKIVADGIEDLNFDPAHSGMHLNAIQFNELTEDTNTIIVDMRNHYESEIGHFEKAITPDVVTFRESLPIIEEQLKEFKDKSIVMYCTGGIRCEKASAYLKYKGFNSVYQLDGGIINYAREVKELELTNKFIGKNFVFDERLGERISDEIISQCHQCGTPCDTHVNCLNNQCHILFIQCDQCKIKYNSSCSKRCDDFNQLSSDQQEVLRSSIEFNGSKFSKGRYKALGKDEPLDLN